MNGLRAASALAFCALAGLSTHAGAAPSGVAVAVVQSAEANGQTGKRVLQPEGPLFTGDQIVTGPAGEAQVRFFDNTRLVVGPNSRMVIDSFVVKDQGTAREVSINAVRGAFRFMTGNSSKDAYQITTPAATIGVRGTEFDFNVDERGLQLALFSGAARICDRQTGRCVEQTGKCSVSLIGPGLKPMDPGRVSTVDRLFKYIRQQTALRREFRVDTSACDANRAASVPANAPTQRSAPTQQFSFSSSSSSSPLETGSSSTPSPTSPTPTTPSPDGGGGHNNNGYGNGGEGNEGPSEGGNPGRGNH